MVNCLYFQQLMCPACLGCCWHSTLHTSVLVWYGITKDYITRCGLRVAAMINYSCSLLVFNIKSDIWTCCLLVWVLVSEMEKSAAGISIWPYGHCWHTQIQQHIANQNIAGLSCWLRGQQRKVHAQVQVDALLGSDERGQNIQNSRNAWKISSVLSNVSEIFLDIRHDVRDFILIKPHNKVAYNKFTASSIQGQKHNKTCFRRRGISVMSGVFPNCRVIHLRVQWCFKMVFVYLELSEYWQERVRMVPRWSESCSEDSGRSFRATD
jgi:hypothetical protein